MIRQRPFDCRFGNRTLLLATLSVESAHGDKATGRLVHVDPCGKQIDKVHHVSGVEKKKGKCEGMIPEGVDQAPNDILPFFAAPLVIGKGI